MKTLKDLGNIVGKVALIRVDFNVPVIDGVVTDDFRIKSAIPTIDCVLNAGAKIVLIAHAEKNGDNGTDSLKSAYGILSGYVQGSAFASKIEDVPYLLNNKRVILLENLRQYDGEKNNDEVFAKELAKLGDFYINDAFSVSHREHASVVGIPKLLPSYAGLQLEKEVSELSKAFDPKHPFVFILGGAKFETKLPLVKKFMNKADWLLVGGALANDIYKAKGINIGCSKISATAIDLSDIVSSQKLMIPVDVVVENSKGKETKLVKNIAIDDCVMDAGEETIKIWEEKIREAAFVLWNGPLGNFEKGYEQGTLSLAGAIASSDAESIVGGGDTLSSIKKLGLQKTFSFISTGGGATLDFLANETLPGIEALRRNQ